MIVAEKQIFNLMDTNGRRSDVVNAMTIYLEILDNIINDKHLTWNHLPQSSAQYEFYIQTLEKSSDVFKDHKKFDEFQEAINSNPELNQSFSSNDYTKLFTPKYSDLVKNLDVNIEARSRHYTSNLVKLGFADEKRNITKIGYQLLYPAKLSKDNIEEILPLNITNIVYLRQLLKLKIFSKDKDKFYSPFLLAIYLLLKNDRISEGDFFDFVQATSPYSSLENLGSSEEIEIPAELNTDNKITQNVFEEYFKNQKSTSAVDIYYAYYDLIYTFIKSESKSDLDKLLTFYEENKEQLKKAFNYGSNIFKTKRGERPDVITFKEKHKDLFTENFNSNFYKKYYKSKEYDGLREYSDTTRRIFKASGIISFDNGFVELAYKEIAKTIFDEEIIKNNIFGASNEQFYTSYENEENCIFYRDLSLIEILSYSATKVTEIKAKIQKEFGGKSLEAIPTILSDKRSQEFNQFILNNYPVEKVKKLLGMFMNRENDKEIKDIVCPDATVPTIYEYIVGIAWFYFSNQKIDLLHSLNLTLSANFEPLTHAGGGRGDIVIYEQNKVVMLEATLMNANSQKHGEWEPVLRHSANLKIQEEMNKTGRFVITFFIADELDYNTINIWKAVSAVSLQSTIDKEKVTRNVIIMPIITSELANLMDKCHEYDKIIFDVKRLFEENPIEFDSNWRKKIMEEIS
ncbi:MAG: AlwI family type II restriction endonuclease [Spirochaetia bacterium]|nr:AlwI family type II restriction endonuclease [Spirochaetia bacterium]